MSNHTKRWERYQASGYLNESPVPETIAISSSSWPGETPADTRRVDEVAVFDSEFLRPRNDSTSRLAVDITAYALQRDQMKIINTEQTKTELIKTNSESCQTATKVWDELKFGNIDICNTNESRCRKDVENYEYLWI
uniref:Uncharacterized protein n=1 Tax=Glossina palpalis gambiensis TaxID=67801 RepID=A0A1B0C2D5_9MUSC